MKRIKNIIYIATLLLAGTCMSSCDKWLDVRSKDEILQKDAFTQAKGYRSALLGIYQEAASYNLWGQELTWGLKSSLSWNYQAGYAVPKYRHPLQYDNYDNNNIRTIVDNIWKTAYFAIANCNSLLQEIENSDADFEYSWEKDLIMAEARGMRALLHFEMLQLFRPAPIVLGSYADQALPYVTTYPDYNPSYVSMEKFLQLVIEDLEYAQKTLAPIDIDEMRNKSSFVVGTTRLDDMNYVLFQGVGNIQPDGSKRDNATASGFFAKRGYRFNYWSATGLLARVYSYMRDFDKAETYANIIIDEWVVPHQFNLYNANPKPTGSTINKIDTKRRPEPILAFYNSQVCTRYTSEAGTTYNRLVKPDALFDGDETTDYRFTGLYDAATYKYRVWNEIQDASQSVNSDVVKYSNPLIPVMELPEVYFIKAECLAQKGMISDALAVLKKIRDARGCTAQLSETDYDSFMKRLVNEAERDFLTRGTTWAFLKKLNWPVMYNGTALGKTLPEGWYVLPMPESETAYQ